MSKIDIDDLNYIYSHEELNPPFRKDKYNSKFSTLLKGIFHTLAKGGQGLFLYLFTKRKRIITCKYLFLAPTLNNKRALVAIQSKMPDSFLLEPIGNEERKIRRYALYYFIKTLYACFISKGYLRKAYISEFKEFCFTYGYYITANQILKKCKPEILFVANDHSALPRSYFRAAQKLGIKTVYIQHASVSINFPSLEFDYAFLDGQESYEKYIYNGKKCKSKVFLSGNPRFDIIKEKIKDLEKNNCRLGISINLQDSIDKVKKFVHDLKEGFSYEVTLRPHPAMDMKYMEKIFQELNCSFSNSLIENSFDFISNNDIFIAGESSIHLDVIMSRKVSLYYNFTCQEVMDWYGYIQHNLIKDISSAPFYFLKELELGKLLKTKKELCQYYVANFNTKYWGRSAELISESLVSVGIIKELWEEKNDIYVIRDN